MLSIVHFSYFVLQCDPLGKLKEILKYEHLGLSYETGKSRKLIGGHITSINHHITTSGHKGNFGDFTIRCHTNNDFEQLIKESLLIGKYKPNLNKQINTFHLSF